MLRTCAIELGDTAILAKDGFATKAVDRESVSTALASGMGWRWY
jgi:hypothetical protein